MEAPEGIEVGLYKDTNEEGCSGLHTGFYEALLLSLH